MIYRAVELLAKLNCLTLVGQNFEGELEWIGSDKKWKGLEFEVEAILRERELSRNFNPK